MSIKSKGRIHRKEKREVAYYFSQLKKQRREHHYFGMSQLTRNPERLYRAYLEEKDRRIAVERKLRKFRNYFPKTTSAVDY